MAAKKKATKKTTKKKVVKKVAKKKAAPVVEEVVEEVEEEAPDEEVEEVVEEVEEEAPATEKEIPAATPGGSVVPPEIAAPAAPATQPPAQQPSTILPPTELEEDGGDDEVPLEKQNKRIYIIGIVVALIVIGATAGVFYYRTQGDTTGDGGETTEVVEESPSPSDTEDQGETEDEEEEDPEVTVLEREDITLEVLNGSGVAGAAGETAETFEELGYEITEIGNADETVGNKLYIRDDLSEEELEILLEDARDELDIDEVTDELSSDDLEAAARIVLGSEEE